MHDPPENRAIAKASPALAALLSPLGERVAFPPDIPFQAAQARGREIDGTIGQITDGTGGVVAPASLTAGLDALETEARNRALLYSPVEGRPEVRSAWRDWQRNRGAEGKPSSLPLVTVGLTHGLSLVADLFAGPGRLVAVPAPFWGNYRQTFSTRTGAIVVSAPAYRDGNFNPRAISEALGDLPPEKGAIAIVNLPSNPGGYSVTDEERASLVESLRGVAQERPLLVVCDDAYAGLVYEDAVSDRSLFWDLIGVDDNLVPVKVDGATKELSFFGGRLGFLTFPFDPETEIAAALESKVKCLTRAALGSPAAVTQVLVHQALASGRAEAEVAAIRDRLGQRCRILQEALAATDPDLLRPMPCNSGCFALIELGPAPARAGIEADAVRRHLLDRHDTGLISIGSSFLRIAFCSVHRDALPELVRRLEQAVRELTDPAK